MNTVSEAEFVLLRVVCFVRFGGAGFGWGFGVFGFVLVWWV